MAKRAKRGKRSMGGIGGMASIGMAALAGLTNLASLPHKALGSKSEPLLDGEYIPTTDVNYIIDLTEILEAIETTTLEKGLEFYRKTTGNNDLSLEHLSLGGLGGDASSLLQTRRRNPLFSIFMYAFYKSENGNGFRGKEDVEREDMQFLDKAVEEYGNTIILDEFEKGSGYNAKLTKETILVTNMWMAAVDALYEGVELCFSGDTTVRDEPNYVDPIDKAAAYWFGTHVDPDSGEGGSLYAWANRARGMYVFTVENEFDPNKEILDGMNQLQIDLDNCLSGSDAPVVGEQMKGIADLVSTYMTVPLVQNLLYYMAVVGGKASSNESDLVDYLILYALLTIPPITVCDEDSFEDLYKMLVTDSRGFKDKDSWYEAVRMLQERYVCLGVECGEIGTPEYLDEDLQMPSCVNPVWSNRIAGYEGTSDQLFDYLQVDLDVRTIGTLVEMEAYDAASKIYNYGRFSIIEPLNQRAAQSSDARNVMATSFSNEYGATYLDQLVRDVLSGSGNFAVATAEQRRVLAEVATVTMILPINAIDLMYESLDACEGGSQQLAGWDRAVASLVGWAEGTEDGGSYSGFLFYSISKYLCSQNGSCDIGGDSEVNSRIMGALKAGKQSLESPNCDIAFDKLKEIEKDLQAVLVDLVAFFADLIESDKTDDENWAKAYGVATAVVPLMREVDSSDADIIKENLGDFNSVDRMANGKSSVWGALKRFAVAKEMDCDIFTSKICDFENTGSVVTGNVGETTDASGIAETTDPTNIVTDQGEGTQSSSSPSAGLLSNAYTPVTNVDYVISLTDDLESIESGDSYEMGFDIYSVDSRPSLKSLSTDAAYESNPLVGILMHGLWESADGDGDIDEPQFDNSPLDLYGHTIVMDEFDKQSGYNAQLTAETIRVANVWMATANSLYEGVGMCEDGAESDVPDGVNPIDQAAAFWIGNHQDPYSVDGGSLYAWANRIGEKFSTTSTSPNELIVDGLVELQQSLGSCLDPDTSSSGRADIAESMRRTVDDITRYMTIPLVQNLLYYIGVNANKVMANDTKDIVDYLILYALVTIPPIDVCDETTFDDLYYGLMHFFDDTDVDSIITKLQSRYVCLGVTCEEIGVGDFMEDNWPTCQEEASADIVGYTTASVVALETSKVDLDVRTIGTLIAIGADNAAWDVFHFGRFAKDDDAGDYISMASRAKEPSHADNVVASSIEAEHGANYLDQLVYNVIGKRPPFSSATATQQRVVVEGTMVTMILHKYAIDRMYYALDICLQGGLGIPDWDAAVASLVGWAEGAEVGGSKDGFLFYRIGKYLCAKAGTCDGNGDAEVNTLLMSALKSGRNNLEVKNCATAENSVKEVELYLQTVLVDVVAYFAEAISYDRSDSENWAEGFSVATALVPFMRGVTDSDADTIKSNMGDFEAQDRLKDGKDAVWGALENFIILKDIRCDLISTKVCSSSAASNETPATTGSTPSSFGDASSVSMGGSNGATSPATPVPITEGGGTSENVVTSVSSLLSGAYIPTSNIDSVVKLTEHLEGIENSDSKDDGMSFYADQDGLTMETLGYDFDWDLIKSTNPLHIIFMYGLWTSDDGDNDNNGYTNKMFDGSDLVDFAATITMDEFDKPSGYDSSLTVETIRLTHMWMSCVTQLYLAVSSCRDGSIDVHISQPTPVDFAAALWFGNHQDADDVDGESLFAWTKLAQESFIEQSIGVNDEIISLLNKVQDSYESCKGISNREVHALEMKFDVDNITRYMMVPLIQNLIHTMAMKSNFVSNVVGSDLDDYLVLYSLMVLPMLSVCDDENFEDLYTTLVTEAVSFDSSKFPDVLGRIQNNFECLGISCEDVGKSQAQAVGWPLCRDPSLNAPMAGFIPTSGKSRAISKADVDVSTILTFIMMEAYDEAMDVYMNGRNMLDDDGLRYLSFDDISIPSNGVAKGIYDKFETDSGIDYTRVTQNSILGLDEFQSLSPLQLSGMAGLALVAIDLHMSILDNMYGSVESCRSSASDRDVFWDRAVALTVGLLEGEDEGGSKENGYLFFDLAQTLCDRFQTCSRDGESQLNKRLMKVFGEGQEYLKNSQCDEAEQSIEEIETLLQTILVDEMALHANFAFTNNEETHYLMAHIVAFALIPLVRSIDETAADSIENILGTSTPSDFASEKLSSIFSALRTFVEKKGIDCALLSSSVCEDKGDSSISESTPPPEPNVSSFSLANGEYTPESDVEYLAEISNVIGDICISNDAATAKAEYSTDDGAGLTLEEMGQLDKFDDLIFNQYVYAIRDGVDKTAGTFTFDGSPVVEYANTIIMDAIDTNINLGCEAIKVLNVWMMVAHKLHEAVRECTEASGRYSAIDEAAALWIGVPTVTSVNGGLLYDLAEKLGSKFGHDEVDGMTFLNRQIVNRLNEAKKFFFMIENRCANDDQAAVDLRVIVKETISFMTAVLVQGLIDSMLAEREEPEKGESIELFSFAFLPQIMSCGQETAYENLKTKLIDDGFDDDMINDVFRTIQASYNCLGLTCSDVGYHNDAPGTLPNCYDDLSLTSYKPANATKTNLAAKLDLDAVAVDQLMSLGKFGLAKDIFLEGQHYYDYEDRSYGFVSLYSMGLDSTIDDVNFEIFQAYTSYLGKNPGQLANDLLLEAFDGDGMFEQATDEQRRLAIKTIISHFISHISSLEALHFAVSKCKPGAPTPLTGWDGGAALFIGSVEGPESEGTAYGEGKFLFGLANDLGCNNFMTCNSDSGSQVNDQILSKLRQGQKFLEDGSCEGATSILEDIEWLYTVPLIQSTLSYAEGVDEDSRLLGHIASMAILPVIDKIDPQSAQVIKSAMDFPPTSSGDDREEVVYAAFATALVNSKSHGIDCAIISDRLCTSMSSGSSTGDNSPDVTGTLVPDGSDITTTDETDNTAPVVPDKINPDEATSISDGLYTATNFVGDVSLIAKDVEEIEFKLQSGDVDGAAFIYSDGLNSKTYNANGLPTGTRDISSFSLKSEDAMHSDPTYNLFVYSLSDTDQEFLGKPVATYADSYVQSLLFSGDQTSVVAASDAMIAMNLWMQVVHKLHESYRSCKSSYVTDGRRNAQEDVSASLSLDQAAAYWIGDSQATGSSSEGHLLYALTEFIGEKFEVIPSDSQSSVNARIVDLFNQAKNHITISKSCSTNKDNHIKIRGIVDEIITFMAIPLLRCLFYYLSEGDSVRVKLYATSVLPLFSVCSPTTYSELKNDLIDGNVFEVPKEYIFSKISSMYDCLGLSCDMVGYMEQDDFTKCSEPRTKVLAGYDSDADYSYVAEHSQIDLDIKHMDIIIANGIYVYSENHRDDVFDSAFDLYKHGHHTNIKGSGYVSLRDLATSNNRDIVPRFSSFRRYFKDDTDYANNIVADALQKRGIFEKANYEKRRRVVAFALRYMITYMAISEKLYNAHQLCANNEKGDAFHAMDVAAGFTIGSLEGEEDGGSFDGNLIFMLAKRMCVQFGTCSESNNAMINERIVSLIYAGQGEIAAGACDALLKTVREIENALLVPLIQGTLFASLQNERSASSKSFSEDFYPEGYVLALSILPIISDADENSANEISRVMVSEFPEPQDSTTLESKGKVFFAIRNALPQIKGVNCAQIGTLQGFGFCPDSPSTIQSSTASKSMTFFSLFLTMAISSLLLL